MASSFMSGLISGFMAFGGGGAIGGAGGSAAGAGASAAGSSGASSAGAGAAAAGGENVGTTSSALSTGDAGGSTPAFSTSGGGSSGGSGDIIRENPYGSGPTDTGPSQGQQAASKALGKLGTGIGQGASAPDSQISMNVPQGNAYNALFGATAANAGGLASSQIGSINAPATPLAQPNPIPGMAPIAPPPQAAPLPMPAASPGLVPLVQPQLGLTSDMRAKQNIRYANAEMDKFLSSVYENVTKKGKK